MSAELSKNDELVANQLRFDFHASGEPAIDGASLKMAPPHEIKIDEIHRVSGSPASSDGYTFYVALIVGLLAVASSGVAWLILHESALPFDFAWFGGSTGNHNVNPKAVSSSLEQTSNSPPVPETQKVDHLQLHDTIVREIARNTPAEASQKPNVSSASTTSVSPAPLSRASKEPTGTPRRTPTPETRPTTIEGWTLREVVNGTAVIEGPNGVWKVTPGQTVPGVGRVDSIVRWGNRLVVATTRGLISTP
jgi:hypothetical protein